jgi:glutamyl-tRNA reductase
MSRRTLQMIGTSHHSAPVEEREKLTVGDDGATGSVRRLLGVSGVEEAVVLSTCNRVEIYVAGPTEDSLDAVERYIGEACSVSRQWLDKYTYRRDHDVAAAHLFRVASSLDSLVVGEPQIVGQVKTAYESARSAGGTGPTLNRAFHQAFHTAKRVRTETGIAENAVSISYAAVELAKKVFGSLRGKSVAVIGAGKMGGLALKHLQAAGCAEFHVINRSRDTAIAAAARVGGAGHGLDALPDLLGVVDIVISSTGSQHFIVKYEDAKLAVAVRKYRPLFLIDIAVPRDVDPRCDTLQNVYLFTVDDLEKVVDANRKTRLAEATRAELIVNDEVRLLMDRMRQTEVVPTIVSLREKLTALKEAELERMLRDNPDLTPEARAAAERMAHSLINKVLHEPTVSLREATNTGHHNALVVAARSLFALGDDEGSGEPSKEGA